MGKVFVAGCSVSDYMDVDVVYGELLAKKLGYEYVHEGAKCGSNWRIWRVITNHIINGNLTSDDLLIVQYTSFERREFWTRNQRAQPLLDLQIRERYNVLDGDIIRFKTNAFTWQDFTNEKKFFHQYENSFLNEDFETEIFNTQNLMFQCMLKEYQIPIIFFGFYHHQFNIKRIPYYENSFFDTDEIRHDPEFLLPDGGHLNKKGHNYVADKLYEFIQTK